MELIAASIGQNTNVKGIKDAPTIQVIFLDYVGENAGIDCVVAISGCQLEYIWNELWLRSWLGDLET